MKPEDIEFSNLLQEEGYDVHTVPDRMGIYFEYSGRIFSLIATRRILNISLSITVEGAGPHDFPRILDAVNCSNKCTGAMKAFALGNLVRLLGRRDRTEGELDTSEGKLRLLSLIKDLMDELIAAADEMTPDLNNPDFAEMLEG